MTTQLRELASSLERSLLELREGRQTDDFANDMFGAVDDLLDLARRLLVADTRVNYPVRVRQERELWSRLDIVLRSRPTEEISRYQPIFAVAGQILSIAQGVTPSKEGHLGFLSIAREQFGFLQTDYGFAIVSEEPVRIRFSSGEVYVELAWARNVSSSCSFGCESNPNKSFWIDDLLFLYSDKRYKSLPEELVLDNENAIKQWVEFLASVFRQYGDDILSGRHGICDELAVAQAARDGEYIQEMERRHKVGSDLT